MDFVLSTVLLAGLTMPVIDPVMEDGLYSHPLLEEPSVGGIGITPSIPLFRRESRPPGDEEQPWDDRRRPGREVRSRGGAPAMQPQDYRRTPAESQIPLVPTDPSAAGYPLPHQGVVENEGSTGPSTSGQRPIVSPLLGSPGAVSGSSPNRSAYDRNRGSASHSRHMQGFASGQIVPNRGMLQAPGTGYSPAQSPTKPFSNYLPSPTVSPYLNMFRDSSGLARSEYYNTLVRPMLEQRSRNSQFGSQLQRLQRNAVQQNTALRSVESGGGSYYQNMQGYYPGFQR